MQDRWSNDSPGFGRDTGLGLNGQHFVKGRSHGNTATGYSGQVLECSPHTIIIHDNPIWSGRDSLSKPDVTLVYISALLHFEIYDNRPTETITGNKGLRFDVHGSERDA